MLFMTNAPEPLITTDCSLGMNSGSIASAHVAGICPAMRADFAPAICFQPLGIRSRGAE